MTHALITIPTMRNCEINSQIYIIIILKRIMCDITNPRLQDSTSQEMLDKMILNRERFCCDCDNRAKE